ncbi:hypothetical protein WB44_04645 [Synechococcus sp. WH 8020]|nr:hypothetical protein WB44_04645 [Synechococcus sp. WH 8020]
MANHLEHSTDEASSLTAQPSIIAAERSCSSSSAEPGCYDFCYLHSCPFYRPDLILELQCLSTVDGLSRHLFCKGEWISHRCVCVITGIHKQNLFIDHLSEGKLLAFTITSTIRFSRLNTNPVSL